MSVELFFYVMQHAHNIYIVDIIKYYYSLKIDVNHIDIQTREPRCLVFHFVILELLLRLEFRTPVVILALQLQTQHFYG